MLPGRGYFLVLLGLFLLDNQFYLIITSDVFVLISRFYSDPHLDSALLHLADGCRRISSDPDIIIQASLIITSVSSDAWLIAFTYDRGKFLR